MLMPVKAFKVLCLLCYLRSVPTVAGLLNFGSKKQRPEPNRQRRPFPTPPPPPSSSSSILSPTFPKVVGKYDECDATSSPVPPALWNSATSSLLSLAASLAPKQIPNQIWTETSARLTINSLPPQSVEIDLQDVPLIGKALSGTFVKINPRQSSKTKITKPSIQIGSPPDKLGALQNVADTGKLQFGLDGIFAIKS